MDIGQFAQILFFVGAGIGFFSYYYIVKQKKDEKPNFFVALIIAVIVGIMLVGML